MNHLIGKRITVFCGTYIYTGKLSEVNPTYITLQDAAVVYETGAFMETEWRDAQPLPHDWNICLTAIESFGILK